MLKKMEEDRRSKIEDGGTSSQSSIFHPQSAVLITGGYHAPNLKNLLKQKNISYVSITPQVYQETNQKRYERLLLGEAFIKSTQPYLSASAGQSFASTAGLVTGNLPENRSDFPSAAVIYSRIKTAIETLPAGQEGARPPPPPSDATPPPPP